MVVPEDGPVIDLESGPIRFALLRLPESSGRSRVEISSLCECFQRDKRLLVPSAHVLDAGFRVLRSVSEAEFLPPPKRFRVGFAGEQRHPTAKATLEFDGDEERYLLVFTDASRAGEELVTLAGPGATGQVGRARLEAVLDQKIRRARGGTLDVKVSPAR